MTVTPLLDPDTLFNVGVASCFVVAALVLVVWVTAAAWVGIVVTTSVHSSRAESSSVRILVFCCFILTILSRYEYASYASLSIPRTAHQGFSPRLPPKKTKSAVRNITLSFSYSLL